MKRSEEINLSNQVELIREHVRKFPEFNSFYLVTDLLKIVSVQDLSFEKDIEFFKEIHFILSVIMSIIAKPHLSHRRDEILARAGEVSSLSQEDFQKTLKDSSLWKDNGNNIELLPEHVYYHTYEDELKIYENIFIVNLINDISYIADSYNALYISLLNVVIDNSKRLLLDEDAQKEAMDSLNYILHRIDQVKGTYFYKEVSRAQNKPKVYYPTNILLKDRLYNVCFKYYKKLHLNDDKTELNDSLFLYYFMLLIKAFVKRKYSVDYRFTQRIKRWTQIYIPERLVFIGDDLRLDLESDRENHQFVITIKDAHDEAVSKHRLIVTSDASFREVEPDDDPRYFTNEYISIWHLGQVRNGKVELVNETLMDEPTLIDTFLDSHHIVIQGSEKIYSSYCPICKDKNINHIDGFYHCEHCHSIYKFRHLKKDVTTNEIIIVRLGKK